MAVRIDDLRLLAMLVRRYVRATSGAATRPYVPAPSPSIPSTRPTRSSSLPDADLPGVIPDAGGPDSISILFAQAACRRVHALALEERQHECRQDSTVELRSARVCVL